MRDQFTETERARSALWSLDPGTDRDNWVRYAMGAKAAGLTFDDFHNWSAEAGNYKNEAECRSVWNSIKDGGVTGPAMEIAANGRSQRARTAMTESRTRSGWTWWRSAPMRTASRFHRALSFQKKAPGMLYAEHCRRSLAISVLSGTPCSQC